MNREDGRGWMNGRAASFLNPNSKNDSEMLRRRESTRDFNRYSTNPSYTPPLSTSSPGPTISLSNNTPPPPNINIPNSNNGTTLSNSYNSSMPNHGFNSITKRTKSIDKGNTAYPPLPHPLPHPPLPPHPRVLETSVSDRGIVRKELPPIPVKQTYSASCIGLTNYAYPVVNTKKKEDGEGDEEGSGDAPPSQESDQNEALKAQKREQLRKQRDALNWSWETNTNNNNNNTNNITSNNNNNNNNNRNSPNGKANGTHESPVSSPGKALTANRGADVEGLMHKAWAKQYKEGELYISVLDAQIQTSRSLAGTEVTIKMQGKILSTQPYGQDFYLEIDEKPIGDLSVQIHTVNRLGQRKKMGRSTIVLSKLEDGKSVDTWYSFNKKKRKGSHKSKGYLKVKIMYISAVTRNKDFSMARENFDKISTLLFDKEGVIVSTLCKLYKEEDLSMALVRLFNSRKQCSFLLMNLMIREIYFSDDTSTLFRRDSMATKVARNFFSLVAKSYLKRYILPFVAFVSYDVSKGNSYEVDPSKLKSTDEITANAARLIAAAKRFLSPILDSCGHLPVSVRMFFYNLSSVLQVRVKTGNPVGALFFLRFVCPAILFPSQYDLMETPLDPSVFRALVLVTKILQNLVNGCLFHEEYMTIFNSFISDNIGSINAFFDSLCTPPQPPNITMDDTLPPYTEDQLVKLLSIIVRKLHMFFDKLQPQIEGDPLFQTAKDKDAQLYLFAQLKTLFLERILTSPTGDESEMKHT